jgi:hypothetical protein
MAQKLQIVVIVNLNSVKMAFDSSRAIFPQTIRAAAIRSTNISFFSIGQLP